MLGAEVRQRGSAGGGGALLLKRIGGRPPECHRGHTPGARGVPIPSRQPRAGGGSVWLVGPRFSRRASRAGPGRRSAHGALGTQGIFLFPAARRSAARALSASGPAALTAEPAAATNLPRCLRASPPYARRFMQSCLRRRRRLPGRRGAAASRGYVSARGWVLRPSDVTACPFTLLCSPSFFPEKTRAAFRAAVDRSTSSRQRTGSW